MTTGTRIPTLTITGMGITTTESEVAVDASLDWLASLLQTSDTLFPSGGYAHSYGLEELVAMGQVTDSTSLKRFLHEDVLPTLERLELPYLRFCHEAALNHDCEALFALDEEIGSWKLTREIREASVSQGRQLLRMLDQVFDDEFARAFARKAIDRESPCHQITVWSILRSSQGAPLESMLIAWVYQSVSTFCSASVKLLRIGEVACQRIIRSCLQPVTVRELVRRSCSVERNDAGWFNPLLDVASARHETAFSRLFIS